MSVAHEEAVIQAVLKDQKIDEGSLKALDTLRICIPLYGHETVANWKERAQAFPDGLQKKIIEAHIPSIDTTHVRQQLEYIRTAQCRPFSY